MFIDHICQYIATKLTDGNGAKRNCYPVQRVFCIENGSFMVNSAELFGDVV